jgi:hypothetical protein
MKLFVKSALFSALGVGCLAVGSGAQQPAAAPPAPAPLRPTVAVDAAAADVIRVAPAQAAGGYGGTTFVRPTQGFTMYGFGDDGKARDLAKKLADAKDSDDKDKLRGQLRDLLSKAFEDRQKAHEKQIEQLEAQVKKLKDMVGKRADAKKEIIDGRIVQLQKEAQGLGW